MDSKVYPVYIGTYSKGAQNGLLYGEFDSAAGTMRLLGNLDVENPSYLQLYNNTLYGVTETHTFNGENGGGLFAASLKKDTTTGASVPQLTAHLGTHGKDPCHLCITGKNILVSNYTEGSLALFKLDGNGGILPSYQSIHHFGHSVNERRQEKPHIHFASPTPDGNFAAICDLGTDNVFFYPYSTENGISLNASAISCPPGSGPRHLVFSYDGAYMYVLMELGNTVLTYKYKNGTATFLQEISTLDGIFKGKSHAAAIRISPDGTRLLASNRGHNSIAVFNISPDGTLALDSHIKTMSTPRDFNFTPDGKWLLAANQDDDSITIYDDTYKEAGKLSNITKPVCIVFGG